MIANFRINKIVGEKTTTEETGKVNLTPSFRIISLKKELHIFFKKNMLLILISSK